LLIASTWRSVFDLTDVQRGESIGEVAGGDLDVLVLPGPTPADVIRRLTLLTGRMRLPPRWALGFHQARWSYQDAQAVRHVAENLRGRRLPADVIVLDIDHMDEYRVFTWNHDAFPDPAKLAEELERDGFKLVVVTNPGVKYQPQGGYDVFDHGAEHGFFLEQPLKPGSPFLGYVWPGLCAFPDFARSDVREWWGGLCRQYTEHGIRGLVNDMNEPSIRDRRLDEANNERVEMPLDVRHGNIESGPHAEVHNVYGTLHDRATFGGLQAAQPDIRPFLLTRAGFAGVQRYAGVWTGDMSSCWEHLESSIPQLLNLGLSGIAFTGADIGGFFGDCGPELLARWMQLGCLYPLARINTARDFVEQEPWTWGEQIEAVCRRALELRYRLLPYLYTVVEEATRTGAPIFRPLMYEYPSDPATHDRHDQALIGQDLLVAPILRPGRDRREVHLPPGRWYDARTDLTFDGPCEIVTSARIDEPVPLYARGGAIIPTGPVMRFSNERPIDPLTLHVYPDASDRARGNLYEDDGTTLDYQRGAHVTTHYEWEDGALGAKSRGSFEPPARSIELVVHPASRRGATARLAG
jgi:alpha-glucosidase